MCAETSRGIFGVFAVFPLSLSLSLSAHPTLTHKIWLLTVVQMVWSLCDRAGALWGPSHNWDERGSVPSGRVISPPPPRTGTSVWNHQCAPLWLLPLSWARASAGVRVPISVREAGLPHPAHGLPPTPRRSPLCLGLFSALQVYRPLHLCLFSFTTSKWLTG